MHIGFLCLPLYDVGIYKKVAINYLEVHSKQCKTMEKLNYRGFSIKLESGKPTSRPIRGHCQIVMSSLND